MLLSAAASGALLALVVSAPLMAPQGAYAGLDGTVGVLDHGWSGGPAGAVYMLGDLLCHQRDAASLHLNGSQLPFCIRDTGILAGLFAGFCVCLALGSRLTSRRWGALGAALVVPTVLEWAAEWSVGDMNGLRLATAVPAGVGIALFLCWLLYRGDPEVAARG